jgi:hypothetical protein
VVQVWARTVRFELEDLEWFPHTIRNLALDYLGFMEVRFALHKPVMSLLRRMFAQTGTLNVVDLCSGRGELVLALYEALTSEGIDVEFTLTDKFPNLAKHGRPPASGGVAVEV